MDRHIIRPDDVRVAAEQAATILSTAVDRDWSRNAAGLEWSCQFTLDHIVGALTAYAGDLAIRTPEEHPVIRPSRPEQRVSKLITLMRVAGAVLSEVCSAAPDSARGYHPDGPADWSGFAALGCTEILMHTDDICWALHLEFYPDNDLCQRVLQRLFPWAPAGDNPMQILRWATGRGYLEGYAPVGERWSMHCRPLNEWKGSEG